MNKLNITPFNHKHRPHGYWERYFADGKLDFKGIFINGNPSGYWEVYYFGGGIKRMEYYIL